MMNDHYSERAFLTIQASADHIEREMCLTAEYQRAPSVLYRPALFIDGNQWCALYGDNIQEGVAGFGPSPEAAMRDFNAAWAKSL